ncbi:T9SS sorting signal type C domain-containing protein [Flavobacterium psychrotolerans]|uniref:G8 domain-containing protein n=1 Tax=Flavobacterium psychrotolerans TaxID=2169410 RepID=A0A2U1JGP1_9FLAO|nr:T9SS sorting signal type C domain-containing protein [Flavobacterium psychrotolerans]PWA04320.1 hypothetical protein DB895_11935 [Flavobacterium psychrotolerans]
MTQLLLLKNKTKHAFFPLLYILFLAPTLLAQSNSFNGATDSNWGTATNWSLGIIPTATHDVTVTGGKNVFIDIAFATCNSLTVTDGNLSISGNLNVVGTTAITIAEGSTLTLENNASLIQSGYEGANIGNINVIRNTTPIILDDYTYWSSPTTGTQTLADFSPLTQRDKIFTYNNAWISANANTETFTKGIGCIFRSPENISTTVPTISPYLFTGTPNNGDVDVSVVLGSNPESLRLVGNPYPSAMDADTFILDNLIGIGSINQTITGTLAFWTHNHTLSGNSYSASDYAKYNLSGQIAVPFGTGNTSAPSGYIASGQGFFVEVIANGNVSFRNYMRLDSGNTNFYRTNPRNTSRAVLEKHRVWLNLTNATTNVSQTLVGYIQSATNGVDPGFDSLLAGTEKFVLYSLINSQPFALQGRALPFKDIDIVPLGYKIDLAGNATITLDHVDGLFLNGQKIFLEDQLLKVTHDLKLAPYTFSTGAGTFNNRFLLRYLNTPLGLENFKDLSQTVAITSTEQEITIKSQLDSIEQVAIFDVLGRLIFENKKINKHEIVVSGLNKGQSLIIKIHLTNGQIVSKKIMH